MILRLHAIRLAGTATALVTAVAVQACASKSVLGWAMAAAYSTDSGMPGHNTAIAVRATAVNGKIRLAVTGLPDEVFGNYTIFDSAAGTITMVFPKGKLVLLASGKPPVAGTEPIIRMEIHVDPGYAVEDLGRGDLILGYATHRYRESLAYETRVTVGGDSCTRHVREVSELWVTPDSGFPDIEASMRRAASGAFSFLSSDMLQKIADARGSRIRGTVIRRTTTADPLAPPDSLPIHMRWEITELRRTRIGRSDFEVPASYNVRDMRAMAGGADSAMRRAVERDGDKSMRDRLCGARGR